MRPATLRFACFLAAGLATAAPAAEVTVHATRNGDILEVVAVAELEGDIARTWRVLTDYSRIAEYVPNLETSRVVSRDRNSTVVDQKGKARMQCRGNVPRPGRRDRAPAARRRVAAGEVA